MNIPLRPQKSSGSVGDGTTVTQKAAAFPQDQLPMNIPVRPAQQPRREMESEDEIPADGWVCPTCTLVNHPQRPGCKACSEARPDAYQIPQRFVEDDGPDGGRRVQDDVMAEQQRLMDEANVSTLR